MILCAALSLLSSRWILEALGQTDFGLYAVVAGIMGFLGFLTGAMTGSSQRHFAYAIGKGATESVNLWFNASLVLHVGLAVFLVVIGLPFGWYMLDHVLSIPAERLVACHAVFYLALVSVFATVLSVPFIGMFTAKQRIFELSVYQIFQTILMTGFAWALTSIKSDRLSTYALGTTVIVLLLAGIQIARCCFGFEECRPKRIRWEELIYIRNLMSFAGWNLFGALGAVGSNQCLAFIINIFCGPKINASFGISNQVSAQVTGISQGFFNSLAPEITASEGRGDRDRVISLALRASKFSVLLVSILVIPLIIEIDSILALWLKEVPINTAMLCRVALIAFLIDKMTIGYMVAVAAHGRIAGYQATVGGVLLFAPVIAWGLFSNGSGVVLSVGGALFCTRIVSSLGRVWWVRRLMNVPMSRWFWAVPVPCLMAIALPLCLVVFIAHLFPPSVSRILTSFLVCGISLCITGWIFGLDSPERVYIVGVVKRSSQKLCRALALEK